MIQNFMKGASVIFAVFTSFVSLSQTSSYYGSMTYNGGSVYRANEFGQPVELIHRFDDLNGSKPLGGLVQLGNRLYGRTQSGGFYNGGVLYYVDPTTNEFGTILHLPASYNTVNNISPYSQKHNNLFYNTGNVPNTKGILYQTDFENGTINTIAEFSNYNVYFKPIISGNYIYVAASKMNGDNNNLIFKVNASTNLVEDTLALDPAVYGKGSFQLTKINDQFAYGLNYSGGINDFGSVTKINLTTFTCDTLHSFTSKKRIIIQSTLHQNNLYFFSYDQSQTNCNFFRYNGNSIDSLFQFPADFSASSRPSIGNFIGNRFVFSQDTLCYSYNLQTQQLNLVGLIDMEEYGFGANWSSLIQYANPLSVNEVADFELKIHPNPAQNILFISNLGEQIQYVITDLAGKSVLEGTADTTFNQIDISRLQLGMYQLKRTDSGRISRFIKQ